MIGMRSLGARRSMPSSKDTKGRCQYHRPYFLSDTGGQELKKQLIKSTLPPPPVIPPPQKDKTNAIKDQLTCETVYVLKVIPEYRENDRSRLILVLGRADNERAMPKLKIRPGMRVQITLPPDKQNTTGNSKIETGE